MHKNNVYISYFKIRQRQWFLDQELISFCYGTHLVVVVVAAAGATFFKKI